MKRKTVGVDPKVPIQAIASVIVFLVSFLGVELSAEASLAIATVIAVVVSALSPAPTTTQESSNV